MTALDANRPVMFLTLEPQAATLIRKCRGIGALGTEVWCLTPRRHHAAASRTARGCFQSAHRGTYCAALRRKCNVLSFCACTKDPALAPLHVMVSESCGELVNRYRRTVLWHTYFVS